MDLLTQSLLRQAITAAGKEDWTKDVFTPGKAFAAVVMSELTYHHIPALEIKNTRRAHLVPSYAFQLLHALENTGDFGTLVAGLDFGGGPIALTPDRLVVVVVPTPNVVFVAIRGSEALADWVMNFNFEQPRVSEPFSTSIGLHEGFFRATLEDRKQIMEALNKFRETRLPLCLTGHSLGGAIAALLFLSSQGETWDNAPLYESIPLSSVITFGMPRFGTDVRPIGFMSHVRRGVDLVPSVPPSGLGYRDCPVIYDTACQPMQSTSQSLTKRALQFLRNAIRFAHVRDHWMERYRFDVSNHQP